MPACVLATNKEAVKRTCLLEDIGVRGFSASALNLEATISGIGICDSHTAHDSHVTTYIKHVSSLLLQTRHQYAFATTFVTFSRSENGLFDHPRCALSC